MPAALREILRDVNMKEAFEWLRGVVCFITSAKRGIYQQERDANVVSPEVEGPRLKCPSFVGPSLKELNR